MPEIDVTKIKPNSHAYKEAQREKEEQAKEKRVEKIVKSEVKVKKKTGVSKFADTFISEDVANVKSYVVNDVLIPALKKAISDIVTNGIDMILYGETGHSKKRTIGSSVSYSSYYDKGRDRHGYERDRVRSSYSFDEVIYNNRAEAEEVIDAMIDLIDRYGVVSVADMYDLAGATSNYTDNKYGWTNLSRAEAVRVNGGYIIKFPRAVPID